MDTIALIEAIIADPASIVYTLSIGLADQAVVSTGMLH